MSTLKAMSSLGGPPAPATTGLDAVNHSGYPDPAMQSEHKPDTVYLGRLLSIADQIQVFSMARKTGEIRVCNAPPPARLAMVDGEITDAQFGKLEGLEAAIALIHLGDPPTEFVSGIKPPRRTIDVPYVQLLFEAARLRDEESNNGNGTNPRRAVSVEFPTLQITVNGVLQTHSVILGHLTIGRSADSNIVIPDPSVSKKHAMIENMVVGVVLQDAGSTNGTYVDGERIQKRWLSGRCTIYFGNISAEFIPPAG